MPRLRCGGALCCLPAKIGEKSGKLNDPIPSRFREICNKDMIALILKELRCHARQSKYRRIQFIILSVLAFALFATAFEQFALSRGRPQILVGESIYTFLIPLFFCLLLGLIVPLQAVESCQIERRGSNWDLLTLTPIGHQKFLLGKLMGAILGLLWCIGLTIPLFGLSVYTGGLGILQLLQCGLVSNYRICRFLFDWRFFYLIRAAESSAGAELCRCVVANFCATYRSRADTVGESSNSLTRTAADIESLVCANRYCTI